MELSEYKHAIVRSIEASIDVKRQLLQDRAVLSGIEDISSILVDAIRNGKKAILFGNGGSAADAQHIAAEFVGRFAFDRPPMPALALNVNTSCITAIGNDYGFDLVFSRQIEALAHSDDVVIGITTSGNSPNVICAMRTARQLGLHTIGLTGSNGGKLKAEVDHCICVPSSETPRIQECHILIGHIVSQLVEATIFGSARRPPAADTIINNGDPQQVAERRQPQSL